MEHKSTRAALRRPREQFICTHSEKYVNVNPSMCDTDRSRLAMSLQKDGRLALSSAQISPRAWCVLARCLLPPANGTRYGRCVCGSMYRSLSKLRNSSPAVAPSVNVFTPSTVIGQSEPCAHAWCYSFVGHGGALRVQLCRMCSAYRTASRTQPAQQKRETGRAADQQRG